MKTWQILAFGDGFERHDVNTGFELSGFVHAEGPDEAFSKAIVLAKAKCPELAQMDKTSFPKPVINADEIQEMIQPQGIELDVVEIHWHDDKTA